MSFEELERKLNEISDKIGIITEQESLQELNKLYGEAEKSEEAGTQFKTTIEKLKFHDSADKRKGVNGTLTPEQLSELEGKYNKLSSALEEAKELRENSTKEKIDDYIKGKIKANKKDQKIYKNENEVLKAKKHGLSGIYSTYEKNKRAQEIAGKIEPLIDKIQSQIDIINDTSKTNEEKESAKKQLKTLGDSVATLLENDAVKDKLGKNAPTFKADLSKYDRATLSNIKNEVSAEKRGYQTAKNNAEIDFNTALRAVNENDYGSTAHVFLGQIDIKYSNIEDKWKALGGQIDKNDKKIQAIKGENDAYRQYAKDVKEQADLEEKEAIAPEDLEEYLRNNEDLDSKVNANADVVDLNTRLTNTNTQLAQFSAKKPKDMDMADVLEYKRRQYLENNDKKARKTLKRVNKAIAKENKKIVRAGGTPQELATMEELLYNAPKVQGVKYRGKNRFGIRSKIPFLKGSYKKKYYNDMCDEYADYETYLNTQLNTKKREAVDAFKSQFVTQTQTQKNNSINQQKEFQKSMYQKNVESREDDDYTI